MHTLAALLDVGSADDVAVLGSERSPQHYSSLRAEIQRLAGQLAAIGIGPGDRVAIVLPNGPEMAVAFLAVATYATAAPLNPRYRADEFRFYLDDLGAKALLTQADDADAALEVAPAGTIAIELEGELGALVLTVDGISPHAGSPRTAGPDDVALVLHTSGTTSRPKIVPLRQRNLSASAANVAASLALTPADRCLNVMPLFHIHGLVAGLLAPLSAGAAVAATPGFDAFSFFAWLEEFAPTYYTAVPTMHQMILTRAGRHADVIARTPLRFVRSSSASLPAPVLEELASVFGVPVIESYGMTEASHQMATNPLPPEVAKVRSVGKASGIEIKIVDGEVVIKGSTVITAYENNPDANAASFTDGWFRTGDEGHLDEDGYLFLTGRIKEIINRGGEKVAPLEVDEVLLRHPAVSEAVTFAVPHDKLGEDVAAAVVLAAGQELSDRELRSYLKERLAAFKVPRTVVFVDEIPKGPTGKMQRIGLAERLGLA